MCLLLLYYFLLLAVGVQVMMCVVFTCRGEGGEVIIWPKTIANSTHTPCATLSNTPLHSLHFLFFALLKSADQNASHCPKINEFWSMWQDRSSANVYSYNFFSYRFYLSDFSSLSYPVACFGATREQPW